MFITTLPPNDLQLFDCISNNEIINNHSCLTAVPGYTPLSLIGKYTSSFGFDFVNEWYARTTTDLLFEVKSFEDNQDLILSVASQLFSNSKPLGEEESEIMERAFLKHIKTKRTI